MIENARGNLAVHEQTALVPKAHRMPSRTLRSEKIRRPRARPAATPTSPRGVSIKALQELHAQAAKTRPEVSPQDLLEGLESAWKGALVDALPLQAFTKQIQQKRLR